MSGPQPPYALVVVADDIDPRYIDEVLTRAYKGNFEAAWELHVATTYQDAPKLRADGFLADGTQPPIPGDFSSPFVGMPLEEAAAWVAAAPVDVAFNRDYFAALDGDSRADDTVQLVRVLKKDAEGRPVELQYFPEKIDYAVIQLATAMGVDFDEALSRYQTQRMVDEKPDRSCGDPYAHISHE